MAFKDFSEFQYEKTSDTSEKIFMGGFQVQQNEELHSIRVKISITGAACCMGNEKFRLKIYADQFLKQTIYTSLDSTLSDIVNDDPLFGTTTNWIGWLRVDFAKENLNKNITYYLGGEFINYVRTPTFVLGLLYDFPDSSYDNGQSNFFDHPIAFQINGFRE